MQIHNDINSFMNQNYGQEHSHHITECMGRHAAKKPDRGRQAAAAGEALKKQGNTVTSFENDGNVIVNHKISLTNKKAGIWRSFWESMGHNEADEGLKHDQPVSVWHTGKNGIFSVFQAVPRIVLFKLQPVKDHLKTGIETALKRFKRDRPDMGLSNFQSGKGSHRRKEEKLRDEINEDNVAEQAQIPSELYGDSFLMDSYNKSGTYCRLNENLTFQRKDSRGDGDGSGDI